MNMQTTKLYVEYIVIGMEALISVSWLTIIKKHKNLNGIWRVEKVHSMWVFRAMLNMNK